MISARTRLQASHAAEPSPSSESPPVGDIVFDAVSFSYRDRPVLQNVSFRIREGETVALVGPSGSGKTTLVKLLLRLYEPDSGKQTELIRVQRCFSSTSNQVWRACKGTRYGDYQFCLRNVYGKEVRGDSLGLMASG